MRYLIFFAIIAILFITPVFAGENATPQEIESVKRLVFDALYMKDPVTRANAQAHLENASFGLDAAMKEFAAGAKDEEADLLFKALEKRGTLVFQSRWEFTNLPEQTKGRYYFWKLTAGTNEEKIDSLWALWSWERVSDKMYEPVLKIYKESKNDLNAKRAAIQVLALLKNPAAIPVFVEVVNSSDNAADKAAMAVRTEAVNGLGNIAAPESAKEIRKILEKEKESPLTGVLLLALGRSAGASAADEMKPFLESKDAQIRAMAVRGILESSSTIPTRAIMPFMLDNDANVRAWAMFVLSFSSDLIYQNYLILAHEETDNKTRFVHDLAITAAFRRGANEVSTDEVKEFLKMNYAFIRVAAAIALLERGELSGLEEFDRRFRGNDMVTVEYRALRAKIPEIPNLPVDVMHDAEQKARLEIRAWLKSNAPNLKWDAEKRIYTKSK
jgi:hypothetical protein